MRKLGTILLLASVISLGGICMGYTQNVPPLLLQGNQIAPPPGGNPPPPPPPGGQPPAPPGSNPPPPGGQPPVPGGVAPNSAPPLSTNTPQNPLTNIPKALNTAESVLKYLQPGKVWVIRGPRGELILKGAILYQGVALDTIKFDPATGGVLPCGYNPYVPSVSISTEAIKRKLTEVIKGLKIAPGVEYREPEACMVIPLIYGYEIVAHLKIYQDGIHVVPDYISTQEMNAYGK